MAAHEIPARQAVRRVLILDCDVYQGNGTAEIEAMDPSVFTMTIHGARNYPLRKHPGSLDVPLKSDPMVLAATAGTGSSAAIARPIACAAAG